MSAFNEVGLIEIALLIIASFETLNAYHFQSTFRA